MTPVYQRLTVDKDGTGDCFNACVASILNIPLEDAYDIFPECEGVWFLNWRKWFRKRGLDLIVCSRLQPPEGYSIVSVETERRYPEGHIDAGRPISHACIALDGVIVHDPFPSPTKTYTLQYYYEIKPFTLVS